MVRYRTYHRLHFLSTEVAPELTMETSELDPSFVFN
ncbi:hypothetical protein LINGRAHAP2_LOCUS11197 [Linum grandiflorum]